MLQVVHMLGLLWVPGLVCKLQRKLDGEPRKAVFVCVTVRVDAALKLRCW